MPRTAVSSRTNTNIRPQLSNSANNVAAQFIRTNSQFLSINDNTFLSMGSGVRMYFCGWFKLDQLPSSVPTTYNLLAKWNTSSNREYRLIVTAADQLRFDVSQNGVASTTISRVGALSLNVWYFIACWYDGTRIYIQLNEESPSSNAFSTDIFDGTAQFRLGAQAGGEFFTGGLQSWGVWKRVLSSDETSWLYNHGKAFRYIDLPESLKESLVAWWDLGEDSGTRADSTANANNLSANGDPMSEEGNVAIPRSLTSTQMTRRISVDPIITDTFSRPDANFLGNTESPMYPWTTTGSWAISTNRATNKALPSQAALVDARISDCVIEATCRRVSSNVGIIGRSRYVFRSSGATNIEIRRLSDGVLLASGVLPFSWASGQTRLMRLEMTGSNIYGYVDGFLVIRLIDSTNQTNTNHGLFTNAPTDSIFFTNFKIY